MKIEPSDFIHGGAIVTHTAAAPLLKEPTALMTDGCLGPDAQIDVCEQP